jgi:DNA-binding NarL/FixJ family response regulator
MLWCCREGAKIVLGKRMRTLVVDDSELARDRICSYLGTEPAIEVVGTAAGGEDALDSFERLHPDLVLLDLQMPGMNGLEVAACLSQSFSPPRIIMVTGVDFSATPDRVQKLGLAGIVSKQHLSEEFPEVLEQILPASKS